MRWRSGVFLGAALCLAMVVGCGSGSKSSNGTSGDIGATRYEISDLGLTIGHDDVVRLDLNNQGQVAGLVHEYSGVPAPPFGDDHEPGSVVDGTNPSWVVTLHQNGIATDLATRFDQQDLDTVRVSDSGMVAGTSHSPGEYWSAVAVDHGSVRKLGPQAGDVCSHGMAVNQIGHMAGWSSDGATMHGCLWKDGSTVDLGALALGDKVQPLDMNDGDDVIGLEYNGSLARSFLWHGGTMTDLGKLDGATECRAESINNSQQIVGSCSFSSSSTTKGFIWQSGHMTTLGTLGGQNSGASCINDIGQVVGSASTSAGEMHAFLWKDGHMVDLNPLIPSGSGWVLTDASVINDSGVIVGVGTYQGTRRAYIMTPAK